MLFYPILCSFLPYFIPYSPTPQVEKTVKTPILPVLTIFVALFPPSPLLYLYFLSFILLLYALSFLLLTSFALSYSIDKKSEAIKNCLALLNYFSLSLRPVPSIMLIAQTIKMSSIRINIKSYPISNQPKNATKNKIRAIITSLYGKTLKPLLLSRTDFSI